MANAQPQKHQFAQCSEQALDVISRALSAFAWNPTGFLLLQEVKAEQKKRQVGGQSSEGSTENI